MSEKKPVWVDLEAHQMLKEYADLTKQSMVELASELVLQHLDELDAPESAAQVEMFAAEEPVVEATPAPEPAVVAEEPIVEVIAEEAEEVAPEPAFEKPRRQRREDDGTVRYFGGVWLV